MYNELYKAWKAEKNSPEPQPLPSDFYQRADTYVKGLDLDSTSTDEQTLQGRLLAREKEVSVRLLEQIREIRLKKIVSASRDGIDITPDALTDEEKRLLDHVTESVTSFKSRGPPAETPSTVQQEQTLQLTVVRFLADVPEIVGVDLRIYGPYRKEDIGSLPSENATALINQGVAKAIEVNS